MIRSDVANCFAEFGASPGMLKNLGPNIGKPQAAGRTFYQTHAQLALKIRNAAADR